MPAPVRCFLLTCLGLAILPGSTHFSLAADAVHIAIIIDDLGYNQARGLRAINLPAALTYSVIPEGEHAGMLARHAHAAGKEVMVHLPMENTNNQPLGKLALTGELKADEIDAVLTQAISQVPHAAGINNHMGSALTQQPQVMAWLMRSIKRHDYFFIDSRTTPRTVASEIARFEQIRSASRDVFLDNDISETAIELEFQRLLTLARQRQSAIGIGHPHDITLDYLERVLPGLESEGIRLIPVSEILAIRSKTPPAHAGATTPVSAGVSRGR